MAAFKPVTHVIFDLDGTLLETEHVFTLMYQTIVERYGKVMTWKLRAKCMARPINEAAALIIRELQLPMTVEEFVTAKYNDFYDMAREEFLKAKLKPGVDRLVRHLHQKGIPIAIATSSRKETYVLKIDSHKELFSLFHHVVNGPDDEEVTKGKPNPQIYEVCADRFDEKPPTEKALTNQLRITSESFLKWLRMGSEPTHVHGRFYFGPQILVFEDSPSGVQAAAGAGMQVILVPDPRLDNSLRGNATLILSSMEDFQPEMFGLPPFPGT